jgi:2'-5' RNA ligase
VRLFVALDLPEAARERLVDWRSSVLAGRNDLRPVAPESLHLTLVFIGYRPEKEIDAIAAAVTSAVDGMPAAALRAARVAAVPPRRPRLFALDLDDDDGRAVAAQAAVSDALEAGRFYKPEKRPFWPHVTFARVKRGARAEPLEAEPPPDAFEAGDVVLYRSHLSPRGATYEALARAQLSATGH